MLDNIAFGIVIGVLFVSLLVLFCALLIKLYINKVKNHAKVLYEKDLEFQKALNSAIIETQEQLLNNISQDLHDDAGQQLTYINFFIENARLDSPQLAEVLDPISDSVRILSNSVRSISHSLNSQVIMQQDLIKAIRAEALRLQKNSRLEIKFNSSGELKKAFGTSEKIVIYRIFQEAINNALKHSGATAITIDVDTEPFCLRVSDNGKGFDTSLAESQQGIGLPNILSRANLINFGVGVESESGTGTVISIFEK